MVAIEARWQSLLKDLDGILKLYFAPQESARKFVVFPHKIGLIRANSLILSR